jgi:ADP-ribose pyrophosphatase YjhB (NUDIX family)
VREIADGGRWTLPGGWADGNVTPAGNAVKEVREESGYEVTVTKLAAVWDRTRQGHPDGVFSCCNMYFLCELAGGEATTSIETSEVQWFSERNIPADLSLARVLPSQIRRLFEHHRQPGLATDFEQGNFAKKNSWAREQHGPDRRQVRANTATTGVRLGLRRRGW